MNVEIAQRWAVIPEFPDYEVSNLGLIFSHLRRRVLSPTANQYGDLRVMLTNRFGRYTRSVPVLVAQAFVPAPDNLADSVIQLDGTKSNVAADNLAWRPRGFAWEYTHQLHGPHPRHYVNLEVTNLRTGVSYPSIVDAGMAEGLLFKEIWRSTHAGTRCYPTLSTFEVTQRV